MAYTVARHKTVFGDKAVVGITLDADAATQTIETGLKKIDFHSVSYVSMSTIVGVKVAVNSNASGVQSYGVIAVSGAASGDRLCVTVFGTR
jgi:3-dehydroquinate synthase class II